MLFLFSTSLSLHFALGGCLHLLSSFNLERFRFVEVISCSILIASEAPGSGCEVENWLGYPYLCFLTKPLLWLLLGNVSELNDEVMCNKRLNCCEIGLPTCSEVGSFGLRLLPQNRAVHGDWKFIKPAHSVAACVATLGTR